MLAIVQTPWQLEHIRLAYPEIMHIQEYSFAKCLGHTNHCCHRFLVIQSEGEELSKRILSKITANKMQPSTTI